MKGETCGKVKEEIKKRKENILAIHEDCNKQRSIGNVKKANRNNIMSVSRS